jgi:hypothetical protein
LCIVNGVESRGSDSCPIEHWHSPSLRTPCSGEAAIRVLEGYTLELREPRAEVAKQASKPSAAAAFPLPREDANLDVGFWSPELNDR